MSFVLTGHSCFEYVSMTEGTGRDDRNATKRMQHQQIAIAGYNHIGMTVDGEFEESVIG